MSKIPSCNLLITSSSSCDIHVSYFLKNSIKRAVEDVKDPLMYVYTLNPKPPQVCLPLSPLPSPLPLPLEWGVRGGVP